MGIAKWFDNLRKHLLRTGYTCDACGGELFCYPARRLCPSCEGKLLRPALPCECCGREKIAEGLCANCKAAPPKYTRGISPFVYRGEVARLVNRLKNGNARLAAYLGEEMGKALLATCAELKEKDLLLLPVPLTKEKRRERGFNQAERLAEGVCNALCAAAVAAQLDCEVLTKNRETQPQKQMSQKERAENVKGAYFVAKRERCKGKTVVLVDDVMTTGSTGNEITKKLWKAGVAEVYFLTAAAVPELK